MDAYEEAWRKGTQDLEAANYYNVDYSLLGTARIEPLLRRIRNSMAAAGLAVENAKGECNFGQHEINFKFDRALATADGHAIYKNGAKEIAAQEGYSISFMPKFDEREATPATSTEPARRGRHACICRWSRFLQDVRELHNEPARLPARVHAVLRPERKLLQALRRRLLRPNSRSLGQGQPPARCASSATGALCAWRTGCPAGTSTRTSPSQP